MRLAPGLASPNLPGDTARTPRLRRRPTVGGGIANPADPRAPREARARLSYLAATCGGTAIAMAWWVPGTFTSAILGWIAAVLLVFAIRARRSYLPAYCCGLACYGLGFYWIFGTVSAFGGFGVVPAALIFALFVALSAVQFLVFAFLHHNLGPAFDACALRAPVALVLSEFAFVRLFRWHYGHTQLAFTPFVQVADLGGSLLVSFLMVWIAEAAVRMIAFRERRWTFLLPVIACGLSLAYGFARMHVYSAPAGREQEVVLVQGNSSLEDRLAPGAALHDISRYRELSRGATRPGALIVWPEAAIPMLLPAEVRSVGEEPALPWIGDGSAFLVGAYAEDRGGRRYNAAFAVHPDGTVPAPYYKRVLIPFGEYMPLASYLPWLQTMSANSGFLTPGDAVKIFSYPMRRADGTAYTLKVAPLICYEDTVPAPACEAALGGAQLLVNLTYDTWFGRTVAPDEHHLIAAFRAIENRRFLVRATNTGLSAVVDPLGRTIAQLPAFSEGAVAAKVVLIDDQTVYARFIRERPWWALLTISIGVVIARHMRAIGLARRDGEIARASVPGFKQLLALASFNRDPRRSV
jgi:apolipoprotein N-acyltransferase